MTKIEVHLDTGRDAMRVGLADVRRWRGVDSTEFFYDHAYLAGPGWDVSPDLPTVEGSAITEGLPGALRDSAPDTWGRNLITRRKASEYRFAAHGAPAITEADFLLGVNDHTRVGALRYRLEGNRSFLASSDGVPDLMALADLYEAARAVEVGEDTGDAVSTLLDAGSGSLGGARPKVSVADGDVLHIAKFRSVSDLWNVIRWEAVALDLAERCGIRTPRHELVEIPGGPVLLVERFDRRGVDRVPFLSGLSLIGASAPGAHDYLDLVEALTEHGSNVTADLEELWRRIALSVALNNIDDHMQNHAFLRSDEGWSLSPIFDINPDARPTLSSVTSVAGATERAGRLRALFEVCEWFGLTRNEAMQHWAEVTGVVSSWRTMAANRGITSREQELFSVILDDQPTTV